MFSYTSEAKKKSFNSIGIENLLEWVHHPNSAIILAVVQILGEQLARTTCLRRSQNHGVPQRELPTGMSLVTGKRLTPKMVTLTQADQRIRGGLSGDFLTQNGFQPLNNEILERGAATHRRNFRPL